MLADVNGVSGTLYVYWKLIIECLRIAPNPITQQIQILYDIRVR